MRIILILSIFFTIVSGQTIIGEGLSGQDLWDYIVSEYKNYYEAEETTPTK